MKLQMKLARQTALAAACFLTCFFVISPAFSEAQAQDSPETEWLNWSDEVLRTAEALPLQEGGRIKPLDTYANFTLLRLAGKRSVRLPSAGDASDSRSEKRAAMPWLLDVLFQPELASEVELFLISDSEVTAAMGLVGLDKKERDRYSFYELRPGLERLFELASELRFIDAKERTRVQQQLFDLANNVQTFLDLAGHMDFARRKMTLPPADGNPVHVELRHLFDNADSVRFSEILERGPALRVLYERHSSNPQSEELRRMLQLASDLAASASTLACIAPVEGMLEEATPESAEASTAESAWYTPDDLFQIAFNGHALPAEHLAALRAWEDMVASRTDMAALPGTLGVFSEQLHNLRNARGEGPKLELELRYYKAKLLSRGLVFFLLAFLAGSLMWLRPDKSAPKHEGQTKPTKIGRGWLQQIARLCLLGGCIFLVAAITMRCMIRNRPPVSTLYETVLFVTAVGTVLTLVLERLTAQRIALTVGAFLGTVGLFIANGYETLDKQDTMPSLVAVLDTNFWLATHVTAITIGYSAGMLAALLASTYLLVKVFAGARVNRDFFKNLSRMVYGVVCFALIFSTVGTILGGIWANDSWGRFWGWDPKENGALLIVLSQIAILHARMSGVLREHGLCMATAFAGTIIAFSWWGVNLLGVGLHSYGFTSGIHSALWTYYIIQWAIVGLGAVAHLRSRSPQSVGA